MTSQIAADEKPPLSPSGLREMESAEAPVPRCAVCGAPLQSSSSAVVVRLERSRLVRCASCGSWTYFPRLTADAQAGLHKAEAYFEHPYFRHRRRSTGPLRRRCREVFTRLADGANLRTLEGERLLDVGCDTGAFLKASAEMFGVLPVGVDVSEAAVDEAKRKGIEAYRASLETAPAHLSNLAAITAIDVIEHVASPWAFLEAVYERLRPSGVVYLETPNVASSVYRVGRVLCRMSHGHPRAFFERLFPVQHAQYFTVDSLRMLAQHCGFEVVRLDTRRLPLRDIGTSLIVKAGVAGLQIADRMVPSDRILICALLRRPHSAAGEQFPRSQT